MQIRDRIKELRRVPARDLIPHKKNWRKHPKAQADAMREVLESIGYAGALLAREDKGKLHLIDGHMRTETTPDAIVPVLVLDVTAAEADTILATFDPLSAMAVADSSKLEELMAGMTIGEGAIADMMKGVRDTAKEMQDMAVTEDEAPAPLPDPVSKTGDLWLLGEHRLLCGDSTVEADVVRLMNGCKADVVLTDPPYGVDYVGKTEHALEVKNDDPEGLPALLRSALGHARRFSRVGCVWYVASPARPIHIEFGIVLRDLGVLRQSLIWVKDSMVLGHSDYHYKHETIYYGWTPGGQHREPPTRTCTSVLEFPRPKASRDHPTMKPIELWAFLLTTSSGMHDLVYEPFSGSGTTIIAAEQLARKCYAIEIEPRYVDVAVRRWQKLTGKAATHSETGKTWEETAKARGVTIKEPTA